MIVFGYVGVTVDPAATLTGVPAEPAWRWAFLGALLGLSLAFVVYAPATWLAAALHKASSGQLQLIEARGTVWTGSARLLFTGGAGSRRVKAASRSHCAGVIAMASDLARRASYSAAETRTPMVAVRRSAGALRGR